FTLYTSDFTYNTEACHIQKFSDDSAVVGCMRDGQEGEYRSLVDNFVQWCRHNHLQLNATKTKEMVVDFRRSQPPLLPVSIKEVSVEVVNTYKYLGVHLDNKLDWSANIDAIYVGSEPALLPEEVEVLVVQCLQQTPFHVLPVCCCQCPFLCCGVLGRQHEEEGCRATRQAGEKGRSCCWHGTGLPNISGGEKDIE